MGRYRRKATGWWDEAVQLNVQFREQCLEAWVWLQRLVHGVTHEEQNVRISFGKTPFEPLQSLVDLAEAKVRIREYSGRNVAAAGLVVQLRDEFPHFFALSGPSVR